jgi:hypothetical protein
MRPYHDDVNARKVLRLNYTGWERWGQKKGVVVTMPEGHGDDARARCEMVVMMLEPVSMPETDDADLREGRVIMSERNDDDFRATS